MAAERAAINMPSRERGDIVKRAMLEMENSWWPRAQRRMLLQVHDESCSSHGGRGGAPGALAKR